MLQVLASRIRPNSDPVTLQFTTRGLSLDSSSRHFMFVWTALNRHRAEKVLDDPMTLPPEEHLDLPPCLHFTKLPLYITPKDVVRVLRTHDPLLILQLRDVSAECAGLLEE